MKNLVPTSILVTLYLSMAGLAHASSFTVTVSGTIVGSEDPAGIFGAPGASLVGDAATVTYIFNPSLLAADGSYETTAPTTESLFGFKNDEALTNIITVNGTMFTQTTSVNSEEQFQTSNVAGLTTVPPLSNSVSESTVVNLTSNLTSDILTYSTTPYQYPTLLENPQPFLDEIAATPTLVIVDIINDSNGAVEASFALSTATPEPSSFSLLMLGLLFVGAITYRQKRKNQWRVAHPCNLN
jgi:PEP-CTERM motif